jgi:hypothetical protein
LLAKKPRARYVTPRMTPLGPRDIPSVVWMMTRLMARLEAPRK